MSQDSNQPQKCLSTTMYARKCHYQKGWSTNHQCSHQYYYRRLHSTEYQRPLGSNQRNNCQSKKLKYSRKYQSLRQALCMQYQHHFHPRNIEHYLVQDNTLLLKFLNNWKCLCKYQSH